MRQREAISKARKRGTIAGRNAASWVFDGNTSDQTRQKVAQMIADGDPELYDVVRCPEWLSGEWAGESVSELLGDILPENEDKADEVCDSYCETADSTFWLEVERLATL